MASQVTEPLCAGCSLMDRHIIHHEGRTYCASCPELPQDKRREPRKDDPVRDGLAQLLKDKR